MELKELVFFVLLSCCIVSIILLIDKIFENRKRLRQNLEKDFNERINIILDEIERQLLDGNTKIPMELNENEVNHLIEMGYIVKKRAESIYEINFNDNE